ncbi:MAG: tetratricopeptide repeat protein [Rhodospirillaceae bacterium]
MRILFYLFLLCCLGGSGWAAWQIFGEHGIDEDPVLKALKRQVAQLETRIEKRDVGAMIELGWILAKPESSLSDPERALSLFRQAAQSGNANAQYAVGWAYANGRGAQIDYGKAAEWYRVAAAAGNQRDAQFALGELYFNGRGVVHDYDQAIRYYRAAALQGHPIAQHLMGVMHVEGWGVKRDLVEAYKWLLLASRQADAVKRYNAAFDPAAEKVKVLVKLNRTQIRMAEDAAAKVSKR